MPHRAGYTFRYESREVRRDGQLVVRTPRSLAAAAAVVAREPLEAQFDPGRMPAQAASPAAGAVAQLLSAPGPKPWLDEEAYGAAVRAHWLP